MDCHFKLQFKTFKVIYCNIKHIRAYFYTLKTEYSAAIPRKLPNIVPVLDDNSLFDAIFDPVRVTASVVTNRQ